MLPVNPVTFFHPEQRPQAAAHAVLAQLPAAEPVPSVSMVAEGRLAIVGEGAVALGWAERLAGQREVLVLASDGPPADAQAALDAGVTVEHGSAIRLTGHLGAFELRWQTAQGAGQATADVVLDLTGDALIKRVELPDGYASAGRDPFEQALAVIDLLAFDGEFEKPRYVALNERLCAHSRSLKNGCSNCLEVCSTEAIVAAGDTVKVDPYLCQGCGTCSTVCPSGALSFHYPRVPDLGLALKQQIAAFRDAGGPAPLVLFHSLEAGRKAMLARQRAGGQLPADVLPVEIWSADAFGLDLMLSVLCLGAGRVAVLAAGSHDPAPLRRQAVLAETILHGLGFAGQFVRILEGDADLDGLSGWAAPTAIPTGEFRPVAEKRSTLELVINHLAKHAPALPEAIALPAGAPFGSVTVSDACTLCMACTSACPASALKTAVDAPRLSFLERNCLQCGLCANTCPEQAITLTPRLLIKDRRQERLLREAEVFCCTACGKPMGAAPTILNMISKLAGHSMFATPEAQARLSMCGDCRVIDLVKNEDSLRAGEMTE